MCDDDDDPAAFLEMFQQQDVKPESVPLLVSETDDPLEDFVPEPEPTLVVDTGSQQVEAILQAAPQADKAVVEDLVGKSTKAFVKALLNPALSKRAIWIRNAIFQQGWVTYAQIKKRYAEYRRAKRDLLDAGITLRSRTINDNNGRTILLEFDPQAFEQQRETRIPLSAKEQEELKARFNHICNLCKSSEYRRCLEADHRIGFEMVRNALYKIEGLDAFQPLCPSCNTKRRHVCNDCPNDDPAECRECQWAYPEKYTHVATVPERRAELVIHNKQLVKVYDALWPRIEALAARRGETPGEVLIRAFVKIKQK